MVKALDLSFNGRIVRVGSNPTPGILLFSSLVFQFVFLFFFFLHILNQISKVGEINFLISFFSFLFAN